MVEQRPRPGGRAGQIRDAGFTWDTGPSLLTMPWVLEETFAAGGLDLASELTLRRLEPLYRIHWAGEERHLDFAPTATRCAPRSARFSARDAAQVEPFLEALRPIYERAILGAGRRDFGALPDFLRLVPDMVRLDALRPLSSFVARHFEHPRVREAFSFHSLFIGGDPHRVPAIYGALVYLQVLDGGWYVDGGMYSVVEALAGALDVRCGEPVERIERAGRPRDRRRAAGGERIAADVVVSNADVLRTHELLGTARAAAAAARDDVLLPALPRHGPRSSGCSTTRCSSATATASSSARSRAAASCRARSRPTSTRPRGPSRGWRPRAATRSRSCCRSRTCARGSTGTARATGCATRSSPTSRRASGWTGSARPSSPSTG